MFEQSLYHTYQRYRTLKTSVISALPIVILMPHSACNCRCVMCDIWKDNKNLKQLEEKDIRSLMAALKKFGTQEVVMSGGEALLNKNFFRFCEILKEREIKITLLSTGLSIERNAQQLLTLVDNIIVSLDGDEQMHDAIRRIPGAYQALKQGVQHIKSLKPDFKITGRTVIHKSNYKKWPEIIASAKEIGLDQISFLPADISSHAFNREVLWAEPRQLEIVLAWEELSTLENVIEYIIKHYSKEFNDRFIAESPEKIKKIYLYYAAFYKLNEMPYKKCNAPWVSTVIEADGTVRPCFFHDAIGNIRTNSLEDILNGKHAINFRQSLDIDKNATCVNCVCYLNLPVQKKLN